MRPWILAPRRSLQVRILASVLLGLGIVVLGLAALVFKITDESTRHALSERLALAQTIQQALELPFLFRHAMLSWQDHPQPFVFRYAFKIVK